MALRASGRKRLDTGNKSRAKISAHLRDGRAADRGYLLSPKYFRGKLIARLPRKPPFVWVGEGWNKYRDVSDYELFLGLEPGEIRRIVERKLSGKEGRLNVLDVGCAEAVFLSGLAGYPGFKERLQLEGIALAKSLSPAEYHEMPKRIAAFAAEKWPKKKFELAQKQKDAIEQLEANARSLKRRIEENGIKIHTGLAETHRYGKKYDLIFSNTTFYTAINQVQALKNTLEHLAPGGEAYIALGKEGNPMEKKEVRKWLQENGITPEHLAYGVAYKFTRTKKA